MSILLVSKLFFSFFQAPSVFSTPNIIASLEKVIQTSGRARPAGPFYVDFACSPSASGAFLQELWLLSSSKPRWVNSPSKCS